MKLNQWTLGLAAVGVVSLASAVRAEEAQHQVMTALSSTTLSGYVDTSMIWKFGNDHGYSYLPGRSYDGPSKQDGFNLNVVKLSLEKPLDEGTWSAGYKVDLLFGPDANTYATTSTLGSSSSDFAIKQAYVNLRAPVGNGLDFKIGVWDTVVGYEVFDAGSNPNYSRSYGFFLEPTTHTGVLASYKVSDMVSLSAGVGNAAASGRSTTATINSRSNIESVKSYVGSITITAPESAGALKGSALYVGIVDSGATSAGYSDVVNYYAGATINTPVTGLSVGLAYDYRGNSSPKNNSSVYAQSAYANAVALYTSFQASEKLKLNFRGEYASGTAGTFGSSKPVGGPNNEEFIGVTATVDYSLWANVISRAEFRWDADVSGGAKSFGGYHYDNSDDKVSVASSSGGYYGNRDYQRNALSLALNVIYKF